MSDVICFNCETPLPLVGKSMMELIKEKFPVFCCLSCSYEFPDNHTKEFDDRLTKLKATREK